MSDNPNSWARSRRIAASQPALEPENYALADSFGLILAETVHALCAVNHYDSSAMDGYAVNATGAAAGPWRLIGPAPRNGQIELAPGQAATILTGGAIPADTTSIVRIEHTSLLDQGVHMLPEQRGSRDLEPGANIRRAGEEAAAGQQILQPGTLIGPAEMAAAAVAGIDTLRCHRAPKVGFVFTGDEVLTSGVPGPGEVRDAFSPYFVSLCAELTHGVQRIPAAPLYQARIDDDLAAMTQELRRASQELDVLITTGGTGFSSADYLRRALAEQKATILVPEISMRPGHPTVLAQLPATPQQQAAGSAGTYVLGLPGNPLAALAGFATVGMPLLAALAGVGELAEFHGVAGDSCRTGRGPRLMPAREENGVIETSKFHGSAMLRGLLGATYFVVVSADTTARDPIPLLPLPWARFNPAGEVH